MAFKMTGFSGFKKETRYLDDKTNPKEQKNPGHNNPGTPDVLYKADGTAVPISQIDEGELGTTTHTDSKGKHAVYSDGTKYYFSNPN